MAQVVERRLPAIYDALDSRNNKVRTTHVCSPGQYDIRRLHTACYASAAGPEADQQRAAKAVKQPSPACLESHYSATNGQGQRGPTGTTTFCCCDSNHCACRLVAQKFLAYIGAFPVKVCEDVRHETPTDETVLSTMAIVYRRASCLQHLSAAFAAASAACPWDEVLLRGVFASHVRQAACA